MCDDGDTVGIVQPHSEIAQHESDDSRNYEILKMANPTLHDYAHFLASSPQEAPDYATRCSNGFIRYGQVASGDKVLIAVTNLHDTEVVEAIASALREKGAKSVDILVIDMGANQEMQYDSEIKRIMRTEGWWAKPRWYDYEERIMNYAVDNGYNMLIHGRGGPIPIANSKGRKLNLKFEAIPWQTKEIFLSRSTVFPEKLNLLINKKAWNMLFKEGRGGKVKLTDPEGTHIEYTLKEKYFDRTLDERGGFGPRPQIGHLMSHPTPPILEEDDTTGVLAGTTAHITRPFPAIKIDIEKSRIERISGGGPYGDAWRNLLDETSNTKYPEFPNKGLFWVWEMAIGTNPKVKRSKNVMMLGSGGTECERNRSGVIHVGSGTRWRGDSERWAAENGIVYGHLHVHLLFPSMEIRSTRGETIKIIENGHLTALDDPEVREMASKYGDPDEILKEDWIPKIPGVSAPGSYEEFSTRPDEWIKHHPG